MTDEPQTTESTPTKADRPMFWRQQHLIGIVAVVVTFIFGASGVYFYFFAEPKARLDIELLTEAVIADLTREPGEQLKLTYGEEQIEIASLISLQVTNSGDLDLVPINHEDLSDRRNARITIEFPKGARILEASAKPTGDDKSTELTQTPTSDPNKVTFVVLLMNENAEAQIDLVVADYRGNRTVLATPLGQGITGEFVAISNDRPGVNTAASLVLGFAGLLCCIALVQLVAKEGGRPDMPLLLRWLLDNSLMFAVIAMILLLSLSAIFWWLAL